MPETGGDPVTPTEVYVGKLKVQLPEWQPWAKAAKEKLDCLMNPEAKAA